MKMVPEEGGARHFYDARTRVRSIAGFSRIEEPPILVDAGEFCPKKILPNQEQKKAITAHRSYELVVSVGFSWLVEHEPELAASVAFGWS